MNLYTSPSVVKKTGIYAEFWLGDILKNGELRDREKHGRIILKWIIEKRS
jgi:hypothetical protein